MLLIVLCGQNSSKFVCVRMCILTSRLGWNELMVGSVKLNNNLPYLLTGAGSVHLPSKRTA